ncbi:putative lipid II flippase FtsW [Sulfoacidibacillus thermotolerans]|nr:putative lipid II flippase FtsW [Sulfoacidibacillus thermotolerans]
MRRHRPDFLLLFSILCLVTFGVVMVYSASMVWAIQVTNASPGYYFKRQLIYALIGIVVMFVFMNIPYTVIHRHAKWITLGILMSLFIVLIPGIGHKAAGVRRWIGPPFLHFQPSEIALVGVLIYLAYIFDKKGEKINSFTRDVMPPLTILGIQFLLILLEPDMGTGMLLLLSGLIVMFVAGIRKVHIFTIGGILLPIIVAFAWLESYRNIRIKIFLNPWNPAYTNKGGYQLQQSLIAIYHGGLFGQGIGRGIEPFLYLPIPHEDFIFAIIVEELGFVGAAFVLGLFAIVIWRGIMISQHLANRFASLLAAGLSSMIGLGVLINVGVVTGLMPITGIPLPFISYGGTALIMKLCAAGILLSLSRYTIPETNSATKKAQGIVQTATFGGKERRPHRRKKRSTAVPSAQSLDVRQ